MCAWCISTWCCKNIMVVHCWHNTSLLSENTWKLIHHACLYYCDIINLNVSTFMNRLFIRHMVIILSYFVITSDPSLTVENLVSVMSLLAHENWKFIWCNLVPREQLDVIENRSSSAEERIHYCCSYYVNRCPTSSWQDVARKLFRDSETAAVERAKAFLPPKGS